MNDNTICHNGSTAYTIGQRQSCVIEDGSHRGTNNCVVASLHLPEAGERLVSQLSVPLRDEMDANREEPQRCGRAILLLGSPSALASVSLSCGRQSKDTSRSSVVPIAKKEVFFEIY